MTLPVALREQIRRRARFTCEFCGIGESDAGGPLTIDHFRPKAKDGSDHPDNLVYCCVRCNQYKLDYWPEKPGEPDLWNPRETPFHETFLELDTGELHPLTPAGEFTLRRLRLNREALLSYRRRRRRRIERDRLLGHYREVTQLLEMVLREQTRLMEEQQRLLEEQRLLLQLLIDRNR